MGSNKKGSNKVGCEKVGSETMGKETMFMKSLLLTIVPVLFMLSGCNSQVMVTDEPGILPIYGGVEGQDIAIETPAGGKVVCVTENAVRTCVPIVEP